MDNLSTPSTHLPGMNGSINSDHVDDVRFSIIGFLYVVLLDIFGLFGNTALFFIILQSEKLRLNLTYLFVINMCLIDILALVAVVPFSAIGIYSRGWVFSNGVCQVVGFMSTFCSLASILAICAIAAERFYIIRLPMEYAANMTVRRVALILTYVWSQAVLLSIGPLLGWNIYTYQGSFGHCSYSLHMKGAHRLYIFALFFFGFVIPGLVMLFMYNGIYRVAHDMSIRVEPSEQHFVTPSPLRHQEKMHNAQVNKDDPRESDFGLTNNTSRGQESTLTSLSNTSSQLQTISANLVQTAMALAQESENGSLPVGDQSTVDTDAVPTVASPETNTSLSSHEQTLSMPRLHNSPVRRPSKAMKTLVVIMLTYLVFWGPHFLLTLLVSLELDVSNETHMALSLLSYSTFAANPVIYGWMNRTVREEMYDFTHNRCPVCVVHSQQAPAEPPGPCEDFFEFLERTSTSPGHFES